MKGKNLKSIYFKGIFRFSTIFSKIIKKEIKADILYENENVRSFNLGIGF